jgi:hypothetical protein
VRQGFRRPSGWAVSTASPFTKSVFRTRNTRAVAFVGTVRVSRPERLRAAQLLAALARGSFRHDEDGVEFLRNLSQAPLSRTLGARQTIADKEIHRQFPQLSDKASALLAPGVFPFVGALKSTQKNLSAAAMRKASARAKEILDALMGLVRRGVRKPPAFASDAHDIAQQYRALAIATRRLEFQFVPPLWVRTRDRGISPSDVPGYGEWHPVLKTLDDLLTWATAKVLATDTAAHLGICEHCGQYYCSRRRENHRFCPETDCRDRYWRAKTGKARVKQSLARKRAVQPAASHRRERPQRQSETQRGHAMIAALPTRTRRFGELRGTSVMPS